MSFGEATRELVGDDGDGAVLCAARDDEVTRLADECDAHAGPLKMPDGMRLKAETSVGKQAESPCDAHVL